MKTLIVFNHTHEGSYCNAILESAMNGLEESSQPYDLIHLDKDGFNPVMNAAELKGLDAQTLDYAGRLQQAEHLVLIFPGIVYRLIFGNALKGSLIIGTFRKLGCRNVKWISLSRVKGASPEKRSRWLHNIKEYFKKV